MEVHGAPGSWGAVLACCMQPRPMRVVAYFCAAVGCVDGAWAFPRVGKAVGSVAEVECSLRGSAVSLVEVMLKRVARSRAARSE